MKKVQTNKYTRFYHMLTLIVFWCLASGSQAATRILDRIDVELGKTENVIKVRLNIPVRYVSDVVNERGTEVDLQLQVIQTRDVDMQDLLGTEQLSWKPSAEVPLDKVVFRGQVTGTSTLQVSFASPVEGFEVRQGKDFYVIEFVLHKRKKVVHVPVQPAGAPVPQTPDVTPPLPVRELPEVIYVINLKSEKIPVDFSKIAPIPVKEGQTLYSTKVMVNQTPWYRLRLGFFPTMEDAKARLNALKNFYPNAWIDRADVEEQRRALELPKGAPLPLAGPVTKPGPAEPVKPASTRLAKMMEMTRRTMTAGEYPKAVRMLEAILEEPNNPYAKEARELLGLARERNGQIAHAKAEYRTYLEMYPEGEDAKRVKQRLLGLETATQAPRQPLREEKKRKTEVEWETYGSFYQNYRRDSINSPDVEAEDSVTRSEIETFVDLNTRRRGETFDMRMKLTTSYIRDLLDESQGDGDQSTLSDAYIDLEHRDTRSNVRLGRQRLRSSGVLSRFDGMVLGYELTPDVRVRAVGGLPVERTKDMYLHEHKQFAGINGDISNIFENWDLSLYYIDQRVDDIIDRRAVGGELRYFDPKRSLFSLVDYDIHYSSLNTFMLQGNWTLDNDVRLYMNLDYRNSPILMTTNALQGEYNPDVYDAVIEPTMTIEDLLKYKTEDEIYDRAKALTAQTRTLALGANWPLTETLQLSGDLTVVNTSGTSRQGIPADQTTTPITPASPDFVEATESTGNEFFYTLQVIKNDLIRDGDIGIFSLRYSDASTSDTIRLSASSRFPVTNFWRISPKLSVSYRENKDNDGTRLMVSPFLQMEYRLRKSITLELEAGMNWFEEDDGTDSTTFTDNFFLAGYRWDF